MGAGISFLRAEQMTWLEHDVKYDQAHRARLLPDLDKFVVGETVHLAYVDREFEGVAFQHWFITNDKWVFEFGGPSLSIYEARVEITPHVPPHYNSVGGGEKLTTIMKQRMRHVLGMKNYSLCFRNCEHVANYVFRGRWVSMQMDDPTGDGSVSGLLMRRFRDHLLDKHKKLINSFPTTLRKAFAQEVRAEPLYPFLTNAPTFTSVDYYLDDAEDTWNYLIIGPMGAGKSRLINAYFNARICDEGESLDAVTKEIAFIRGETLAEVETDTDAQGAGAVVRRRQKVVLIDTIGLCDTEWLEEDLHRLIKNRVSSNTPKIHGVLVLVPSTERLNPHAKASIKALLEWMDYEHNAGLFNFLLTKTDRLAGTPDEITADQERLRSQLTEAFGIRAVPRLRGAHTPVYFTAFPRDVPELRQDEFQRMYDDAFFAATGADGDPVVVRPETAKWCAIM